MRRYEEWELIPKPERQTNGYRIFTEFHLEQIRLLRLALHVPLVQNGLRHKIVRMLKVSATGDFDEALAITLEYLAQIRQEQSHAEEAVSLAKQILSGHKAENHFTMKRKEVSEYLGISMDTLRNWEMNGLLTVKRKENGYRIYTEEEIRRLKMIRSLKCANYSLVSILRMLGQFSRDPDSDIQKILDTPEPEEDIISVYDQLRISLADAEQNSLLMIEKLKEMKSKFI